jgi:NCS1 family nucleobase:cation symporter-1
MSFFTGFGVSALVYFSLNIVFPVPGKYAIFEEVDVSEGDSVGSTAEDERDVDSGKKHSSEETV